MFVNEYVMDRRRYDKWATPKFWKLPIFYVYCAIFVAGIFGWIYFDKVDAPRKVADSRGFSHLRSSIQRSIFQMGARRQDLPRNTRNLL